VKEGTMHRRTAPPERRQLGVKIDVELWRQLRAFAVKRGINAFELLEQAIAEFLQKHRGEGQ